MAYFEWKEEYRIGINKIDQQHKKLIDVLNELYEAMKVGKGKDVLESTLVKLVEYTKTHFSTEENMMSEFNYPGLLKHRQEHAQFITQIQDFQNRYTTSKLTLSVETSNFLKDWLSNHILKTDQQYKPYLADLKK